MCRKKWLNGAVSRNNRIKRVVPCRCLDGHVKEPYEMSMALGPTSPTHYLLITLSEHDLFTKFYITELERFRQNICNGCGMQAGDADSSGHLVPSLWELHMFYLLRPILFPNLSLFFQTMLFEYLSVLSRFCPSVRLHIYVPSHIWLKYRWLWR